MLIGVQSSSYPIGFRVLFAALLWGAASLSAQEAARARAFAAPAVESVSLGSPAEVDVASSRADLVSAFAEAGQILARVETDAAFSASLRAVAEGNQRQSAQMLLADAGFPHSTVTSTGDASSRTIVIEIKVKNVVIRIVIRI